MTGFLPDVARDVLAWTFMGSACWFVLATLLWGVYQWKIVNRWEQTGTLREKLLETLVFYLTVAFFPWSYIGLWMSDKIHAMMAPKPPR